MFWFMLNVYIDLCLMYVLIYFQCMFWFMFWFMLNVCLDLCLMYILSSLVLAWLLLSCLLLSWLGLACKYIHWWVYLCWLMICFILCFDLIYALIYASIYAYNLNKVVPEKLLKVFNQLENQFLDNLEQLFWIYLIQILSFWCCVYLLSVCCVYLLCLFLCVYLLCLFVVLPEWYGLCPFIAYQFWSLEVSEVFIFKFSCPFDIVNVTSTREVENKLSCNLLGPQLMSKECICIPG